MMDAANDVAYGREGGVMDPALLEQAVRWMADELQRDTCTDEDEAKDYAAGLLTGFRLGSPILAASMIGLGEESCRALVREGLALERGDGANGSD